MALRIVKIINKLKNPLSLTVDGGTEAKKRSPYHSIYIFLDARDWIQKNERIEMVYIYDLSIRIWSNVG